MPVLWYVYWLVVGLYLLAVLLASIQAALKEKNLALLPWLPLVFLAVHSGLRLGSDRGIGVWKKHGTNEIRGESRRSLVMANPT